MLRRVRTIICIALVAGAAFAQAAAASTTAAVNLSGSTLSYVAGPGENNDLTVDVDFDGVMTLTEAGSEVADPNPDVTLDLQSGGPPGPCLLTDPYTVSCSAAAITRLVINLGDEQSTTSTGCGPSGGAGDCVELIDVTIPATINGGSGDDDITGGDGNDIIDGGEGGDAIDGGEGTDTVDYSSRTASKAVNVTIDDPPPFNDGNPSDGTTGGDCSADSATCTPNCTVGACDDIAGTVENVYGTPGNDKLTGDGGQNLLRGNLGNDLLDGGLGNDTADYSNLIVAVNASLGTPGSASGGAGGDTLTGFENLIGGSGNDQLTGDGADNVLTGRLGNDALTGGGGSDTADYSDATVSLNVNLGIATAQATGWGTDMLNSLENLVGGSGNDSLTGSSVVNSIWGNGGNDTINSRDSVQDNIVNCGGEGGDKAIIDPIDAPKVVACATIDDGTAVPPPPGGGAGGGAGASGGGGSGVSADRTAPKMAIVSKSTKMSKKGVVKLSISCPTGESACSGDITLGKGSTGSSANKVLGKASFKSVAGGKRTTVPIKLSNAAKKKVRKKRKLKTTVTVKARDAAGNVGTSSASLVIRK